MTGSAFTKEQFNKIYPEGIGNHYWNHARNRIIRWFLKKHGLDAGKIIEIGCGRGVVLDFLRKSGINCLGAELGDPEPISGTGDYIFTKTDAFELPAELRQSFNTVLLFDVIEHIENPSEFLFNIRQKFVNAKYMVITVPARQELWTNYDEFNGHYKRYKLTDLRDLSTTGFSLLEACYFNHLLYPVFWIFARFIKKEELISRRLTESPFFFTGSFHFSCRLIFIYSLHDCTELQLLLFFHCHSLPGSNGLFHMAYLGSGIEE